MTRFRIFVSVLLAVAVVSTPVAAGIVDETPVDGSPAVHSSSGVASMTESSTPVPGCEYPVELRDASGETVSLDEPAESVVTTGPAAAQTMWEFGAQETVVGLTQFSYYLEGATDKRNVSGEGRQRLSIERVVALDPDVVLAENITSPETVQSLRDAGLTVYYFNNSESLDDVYSKVATTGTLVGECDAAVESVRGMKEELAIVEAATEDEEPKDFLYALYGYTAGENTFIHAALTAAGGNNLAVGVVEFPPSGYAPINPETVANLSVEWIVYPGFKSAIPQNAAWNETIAMQEGNLIAVDENRISQPAPRVALAVRDVVKAWYPEAYESANESMRGNVDVTVDIYASTDDEPTTVDDDEPTTTAADEMTATETTAGDDGSTPGFGPVAVLVALVAVLGTAVLRRNRN